MTIEEKVSSATRPIPKALRAIDRELFYTAKKLEILDKISWKPTTKVAFLRAWAKGTATLPVVETPKIHCRNEIEQLQRIIKRCPKMHPLSAFLKATAKSYIQALRMLEAAGTKRFLEYSTRLYGQPSDTFNDQGASLHKAALQHLRAVKRFNMQSILPPETICIMPEYVASRIRSKAQKTFPDESIKVVLDKKLVSKAAAGPTRIRLRQATCFAPHDVPQLIEHELMVHTLTLRNGRKQPLKSLGLNAPRTTVSQEGLAVFAEFITNSIDVSRLCRISARVRAIQMGIDGADFMEVFLFFLKCGQSEEESYYSASRVFRGGRVKGGVVFTKDIAYLKGFIQVHRFFLACLENENFQYLHYFLAGRMRTEDVATLAPFFESSILHMPAYEPDWIKSQTTLLAFLLSSSVMNNLGLSTIR